MKTTGTITEKAQARKCDCMITVNGSLSDYFKTKYKIPSPEVIMNCPITVEPHGSVDFRKLFNWDQHDFIFIYQGLLNEGRGLKLLLNTWHDIPSSYKLVIIGKGILKNELQAIANKYSDKNNVQFIDHVEYSKLPKYTAGADCGINLLEPYNLSKKLALPNKLFEYIHSYIPVISSNTIESQKIFDNFEIGLQTSNEKNDLLNSIHKIAGMNKKHFFSASEKARKYYNWENEEEKIYTILKKW